MAGEPDRDWLGQALRAAAHEWADWARAAAAVIAAPGRFAREWADGTRDALNPAYYLLNSAALLGVMLLVLRRLLGVEGASDGPLWVELLQPLRSFTAGLFWMVPGHVILRLLGGRRPLRTTYAIYAYLFGGPVVLLSLPVTALAALAWSGGRTPGPALEHAADVCELGLLGVGVAYGAVALAATHRLTLWRGLLATALLATAGTAARGWLWAHQWSIARLL